MESTSDRSSGRDCSAERDWRALERAVLRERFVRQGYLVTGESLSPTAIADLLHALETTDRPLPEPPG